MKCKCAWCGVEFVSKKYHKSRYCSHKCALRATGRARTAAAEAKAAALGMSLDEYRLARHRVYNQQHRLKAATRVDAAGIEGIQGGYVRKWKKRQPKTYAQIKAENRRRGSVAGWRGQPVLGGGLDQNWRDPMFMVAEV